MRPVGRESDSHRERGQVFLSVRELRDGVPEPQPDDVAVGRDAHDAAEDTGEVEWGVGRRGGDVVAYGGGR
jgi:hypothetical protein